MFDVEALFALVLAVYFAGDGSMKLIGQRQVMDGLSRLGVSSPLARVIGAGQVLGAAGLLAGLTYPWAGVAAAVLLAVLTVIMIVLHVRANDYKDPGLRGPALVPIVFLLLTITAILRGVTG
ncbi:MAG: DoxX family protein [Micromonosporaceae bacterium]